jgi:hypothetical protein
MARVTTPPDASHGDCSCARAFLIRDQAAEVPRTRVLGGLRDRGQEPEVIRRSYQVLAAILTEAKLSKRIQKKSRLQNRATSGAEGIQRFLSPADVRKLVGSIAPRFIAV